MGVFPPGQISVVSIHLSVDLRRLFLRNTPYFIQGNLVFCLAERPFADSSCACSCAIGSVTLMSPFIGSVDCPLVVVVRRGSEEGGKPTEEVGVNSVEFGYVDS